RSGLPPRWTDGRKMADVAAEFIKPNDRLTPFERLEIYSRSYWFRILDCFYDDFPGLRAVIGPRMFLKLAEAYLAKYPSASFTLRNLGSRLEKFLRAEPQWVGRRFDLALDVVRFEWAQVTAFDDAALTPLHIDELLGADPAKLRLGLQPYIALLELDYPVDDFILALKKHDALRAEASNAKTSAPKATRLKKVPLPRRKKTCVAVHRHENSLYYKPLTPESYALLTALRKGRTITDACERAFRNAPTNIDWSTKIKDWFQSWSSLGWFCKYEYTKS
ncbi:MAG TPA: DNA-binding domain-containing protein, partial [Chthoniobacteraceae bacterium]|nr:DNA-binding domain-containing protein [Chthoniobacteraceae bacterium]